MTVQTREINEEKLAGKGQKHLNNVALRAYSVQKQSAQGQIDNEQITELLPMVHNIARRVVTYLKPPLTFEDMISAGTVGLVRAARDFDPSQKAEFKTYAYIRIKGAILDELRGWSFMPENLRKRITSARQLSRKITEDTGTTPSDGELAEKLGISVEELYETYENARAQNFISLDGFGEDTPVLSNLLTSSNPVAPEDKIEREELIEQLSGAIRQLPERQRQVILLYYHQQLTMKQIAEVLEVTESRVSQLHAGALFTLSVKLRQFKDGRL